MGLEMEGKAALFSLVRQMGETEVLARLPRKTALLHLVGKLEKDNLEDDFKQIPGLLEGWHKQQRTLSEKLQETICRKMIRYPEILYPILTQPSTYGFWMTYAKGKFMLHSLLQDEKQQVKALESMASTTIGLALNSDDKPTDRKTVFLGYALAFYSRLLQRSPDTKSIVGFLQASAEEYLSRPEVKEEGETESKRKRLFRRRGLSRDYQTIHEGLIRVNELLPNTVDQKHLQDAERLSVLAG